MVDDSCIVNMILRTNSPLLLAGVFALSFFTLSGGQNCFNGDVVDGSCQCFSGWTGGSCNQCGGRIRLEGSSGMIADHIGGGSYSHNSACLFFIETDSNVSSIRLRLNSFFTECRWDYLYVFDGDSIYSTKLAAFTGNLIELEDDSPNLPDPVPSINGTMEDNSTESGSGSGSGSEIIPYEEPTEVTLTSTGAQVMLYFYSDAGANAPGFNLSYWVDYECPDNCSGQGVCQDGVCRCDPGWVGELCHLPACPGDCLGNGVCNDSLQQCVCFEGFIGSNCSIPVESPHWESVKVTVSDEALLSGLARAGHSAVVWEEDMIAYGGYRFPLGDEESDNDDTNPPQLLRYSFASRRWEGLTASALSLPDPRHGHTAVVYNSSMYVFGGAKTPAEEITSELWVLDLVTFEWTDLSPDRDIMNSSSDGNATLSDDPGVVSMETLRVSPQEDYLPLPVRSHTAHVIGSKMVVLFGLTSDSLHLIDFVQEYDFEMDTWSTPEQYGVEPVGRMGHSSVYHPETGLIYVYGGHSDQEVLGDLLSYDPVTHTWSRLTSGTPRYLHSATLLGALMLTFGGSNISTNGAEECFSRDVLLYSIACNTWQQLDYPGLPGNSSRYGHSALLDPTYPSLLVFGGFFGLLHGDLLRLDLGNCSSYLTREECLNGSQLCAWSSEGGCVSAGAEGELSYQCEADLCHSYRSCNDCVAAIGCRYDSQTRSCAASDNNSTEECQEEASGCGRYRSCESCHSHDCQWDSATCAPVQDPDGPDLSPSNCSATTSCYSQTTCGDCTSGTNCLWCPSLQQCIPRAYAYPYTYLYGQCLGWTTTCPHDCPTFPNCTSCGDIVGCGWCNDPSDTGLGVCAEGGFTESRNSSLCPQERWYFDQCPACQCNGHSTCVNDTAICEECQNNTTGGNCEMCSDGFFGSALNGNTCSVCDCNGYNPICNRDNGTCDCLDIGVTGNRCSSCDTDSRYTGDANNICFFPLSVGFVYTFGVPDPGMSDPGMSDVGETQTFYVVTPTNDKKLNFKFDITENPRRQTITLQLFVGRFSENYWALVNITDPISLENLDEFSRDLDDFGSNSIPSEAQLFTFARPSIRSNPNFTALFQLRAENDYTDHMWDGDVSLVIYASNLVSPMTFRITVDQMDLIFLLYFFATFVSCFTVLLVTFLAGWYIKRKLARRALVRQQYIELQRRVSRPFAKLKLVISKTREQDIPQLPSYAAVETCKDNRGAVLSLCVRLPGDSKTGKPAPGRTGICFGSTLVKVNPSKRSKDKQKKRERQRDRGNSTSPETEEQ